MRPRGDARPPSAAGGRHPPRATRWQRGAGSRPLPPRGHPATVTPVDSPLPPTPPQPPPPSPKGFHHQPRGGRVGRPARTPRPAKNNGVATAGRADTAATDRCAVLRGRGASPRRPWVGRPPAAETGGGGRGTGRLRRGKLVEAGARAVRGLGGNPPPAVWDDSADRSPEPAAFARRPSRLGVGDRRGGSGRPRPLRRPGGRRGARIDTPRRRRRQGGGDPRWAVAAPRCSGKGGGGLRAGPPDAKWGDAWQAASATTPAAVQGGGAARLAAVAPAVTASSRSSGGAARRRPARPDLVGAAGSGSTWRRGVGHSPWDPGERGRSVTVLFQLG